MEVLEDDENEEYGVIPGSVRDVLRANIDDFNTKALADDEGNMETIASAAITASNNAATAANAVTTLYAPHIAPEAGVAEINSDEGRCCLAVTVLAA